MSVVQLLRPAAEPPEGSDRVNVVRLVEFLGPISPELALVDPELAERARALLPEAGSIRHPRRQTGVEPLVSLPSSPQPRSPRRLSGVWVPLGVAAMLAVYVWTAFGLRDDEPAPAIRSSPPVAAPPLGTVPFEPTQRSHPKPPVLASPRFVWAAEPGADGYRVALYRGGRQVFERDVAATALQLRRNWRYEGRSYELTTGTYRWVVWPLFSTGANARVGPAIVSSRYVI